MSVRSPVVELSFKPFGSSCHYALHIIMSRCLCCTPYWDLTPVPPGLFGCLYAIQVSQVLQLAKESSQPAQASQQSSQPSQQSGSRRFGPRGKQFKMRSECVRWPVLNVLLLHHRDVQVDSPEAGLFMRSSSHNSSRGLVYSSLGDRFSSSVRLALEGLTNLISPDPNRHSLMPCQWNKQKMRTEEWLQGLTLFLSDTVCLRCLPFGLPRYFSVTGGASASGALRG
ncbi:hypothetical protein F511_21297 [Dorcoceras hygrometricum]|uniref:Uncharacterized protein n=1 Tax=Dorcoceras hygrometricum TaxID=472368 RepID=A0A2Z7BL14_9LAMI|nr:hypothetical protein F511_21297 [Dorcoceras hygrometricum]